MRRKGVTKRQRVSLTRPEAQRFVLRAPIGGLNTRDSLAEMPATDAIELVNWIPQQGGLTTREGYSLATGNPNYVFNDTNNFIFNDGNDFVFNGGASVLYQGQVETIISYVNGSTKIMVTASGDELYTDNGNNTLTVIGTGYSSALWEGVQLGANLMLVNGVDAPLNFDGSTLSTISFSGDIATYGVEKIDNAHKHKNRVYLWDTDNNSFFYGGVNAVAGSFAEFPLNRVSDTGGNLIEMKTISRDAGNGSDDYAAFILDTGEVLIYQGSDPSDADNWALVGKYRMPPIIGKRCAAEFAGDVMVLTREDLVKLSSVIKFGGEAGGFNLQPSKLSGAIRDFYNTYGTNSGFSLTLYPSKSLIIANMPQVTNASYIQYVINTVTGAGAEFNGLNFNCFAVHNQALYAGVEQAIVNALSGTSDDGDEIQVTGRGAFTDLGSPQKKYITAATQYVESEGSVDIAFSLSYDFTLNNFGGATPSSVVGAEWDLATWDEAEWAGKISPNLKFVTTGYGTTISPQMQFNIKGQQVTWYEGRYNFKLSTTY